MKTEYKIIREASDGERGIYNSLILSDSLPYRPLDEEEFNRIFHIGGELTISAINDECKTVGFLSARLPNSDGVSYLTYFGVLPEYRSCSCASELLDEAENILRNEYHAKRIDIVFHNPAHLPWIIPDSADGHPCAPGIRSDSPAASLLLRRGYAEWCAQISYYSSLDGYKTPEDQAKRLSSLAENGIRITYYDPVEHRGLAELFDAINNPGWKKTVLAHLDQPIVVAVDEKANGLVVGYTGPLSQVREGGGLRGSFCGIGTHPDYRGRGIATLIFCEMCRHHSEHGASFMSLYTGENNPARRVYEYAGCRGVVRWSNLRLKFN
jgi:ribosomal protein S18 acetylase RimI-like enzyme